MTVEEIFSTIAEHMKQGINIHCAFSQAYDFLGLYGFSKCHEYHQAAENSGYACLLHYYSSRYHKLLEIKDKSIPEIIPANWYKYTTMAVDAQTKRNAVQSMMQQWVSWERETKALYQTMYNELLDINEIAAASKIKCYICDVDKELKHAEKKLIKLETLTYDIGTLVKWQESMYDKFKKKIKQLY